MLLLNCSTMSSAELEKWISGEAEVFFAARGMPASVAADANPRQVMPTGRSWIGKWKHGAIAAVVATAAAITALSLVISTRPSREPFVAARTTSTRSGTATKAVELDGAQKSDRPAAQPLTTPIPTLIPPISESMPQFSDAQLAAFLREVSLWYDRRTQAGLTPHNGTRSNFDILKQGYALLDSRRRARSLRSRSVLSRPVK